jgi:guanine deaminase
MPWPNTARGRHTFPTEQKYSDKEFARSVAKVFLQENLRNGITCGCIYRTVYPQSVDALFEEAEKLGMRLAAGTSIPAATLPILSSRYMA